MAPRNRLALASLALLALVGAWTGAHALSAWGRENEGYWRDGNRPILLRKGGCFVLEDVHTTGLGMGLSMAGERFFVAVEPERQDDRPRLGTRFSRLCKAAGSNRMLLLRGPDTVAVRVLERERRR